jgi:hypothetical protein
VDVVGVDHVADHDPVDDDVERPPARGIGIRKGCQ